jgi:hypothetical protein
VVGGGGGYADGDVLSLKFDPTFIVTDIGEMTAVPGVLDAIDIIGTITSNNANLLDGTFVGMKLFGGTGNGAIVDVTVASNVVTSCIVTSGGGGYTDGDQLFLRFDPSFTLYDAVEITPEPWFTVMQATNMQNRIHDAQITVYIANNDITTTGEFILAGELINAVTFNPTNTLVDGTHNMPLLGGTGTGAMVDVVVSGKTVISVIVAIIGSGYSDGDILTLDFGFPITNVGEMTGFPGDLDVGIDLMTVATANPTNLVDGTYNALPLLGGAGAGAAVDVTVASGTITSAITSAGGTGYADNDVLYLDFGVLDLVDISNSTVKYVPTNLPDNGVFTGIQLYGGSGTGVLADVEVANGAVKFANITAGGMFYSDATCLLLVLKLLLLLQVPGK